MIRDCLSWLAYFAASFTASQALADQPAGNQGDRAPAAHAVLRLPGPCDWAVNTDSRKTTPLTLFDDETQIIFYVESDGRHVAAFSLKGEILWLRDPFVEGHLCPYRVSRPTIISIEQSPRDRDTVVVRFDSSQFGTLVKRSGEFTPLGQN